jgi:uncharacterized protein YegP (UPF0339 family)
LGYGDQRTCNRRLGPGGLLPPYFFTQGKFLMGLYHEIERGEDGSNMEFELYEDAEGKWRWRLWSASGENIANGGQGWKQKQNAETEIILVRKCLKAKIKNGSGLIENIESFF